MRLRFAPSPTGYLHIGNARTAIINYLLSKKYGAEMVLRIEDTDMERSTRESELSILDDLKWLGIEWTEGPDLPGTHGPYRQSERFGIYREYTEKLIQSGAAYYCYCNHDELEQMREKAVREKSNTMYDGRCRNLTAQQCQAFEKEGRLPTVRFRVDDNIEVAFDDALKGHVRFESSNIGGDFIIVRSDGVPVYNYIVVIDDALMEVTHVVRGEDHLSNTPKQILIARALGFAPVQYAHMPLVMGEDKKKLSKRHGITSVALFRDEGYLSSALVNYISMLGWAAASGEEILSVAQIAEEISLERLAASAAVFDFKKLRWMNAQHIRRMNAEELYPLIKPYLDKAGLDTQSCEHGWLMRLVEFTKNYLELLSEAPLHMAMFLAELPDPRDEALDVLRSPEGLKALDAAHEIVSSNIDEEVFFTSFVDKVKEMTSLKGKNLFQPCRIIMASTAHGPDLAETMRLFGFEKCKRRIEYIYGKFGGNA